MKHPGVDIPVAWLWGGTGDVDGDVDEFVGGMGDTVEYSMNEGVGLEGIGRVFSVGSVESFRVRVVRAEERGWSERCLFEYSAWTSRDSYQLLQTFEHQPHRVHNDFSTPCAISKQRFSF